MRNSTVAAKNSMVHVAPFSAALETGSPQDSTTCIFFSFFTNHKNIAFQMGWGRGRLVMIGGGQGETGSLRCSRSQVWQSQRFMYPSQMMGLILPFEAFTL